jgi:hypothetical protein
LFADFSPDGSLVITGCNDNDARIWDVADPSHPVRRHRLQGHTAAVTSAAISRDNLRAATGSQDGMAKIWRLPRKAAVNAVDATGGAKEVLSLKRHGAEVTSVHFSPDGQSVLTSSLDQTAILWPAVPVGPSLRITSPRFEVPPDGRWHIVDANAEVLDPDVSDLGGGTLTVQADGNANALRLSLDLAEAASLRRTGEGQARIELDGRQLATLHALVQPAIGLELRFSPDIQTPEVERIVRALSARIPPPLRSVSATAPGAATPPTASPPVGITLELRSSEGNVLSQASTSIQPLEEADSTRADLARRP